MSLPWNEWRLNKSVSVPYAGKVEFRTLWEDKRDVMCDSPRPEWGVADCEKNRLVEWTDLRGKRSVAVVDRDTGNEMYKRVAALTKPGSGFPPAHLEEMFKEVM